MATTPLTEKEIVAARNKIGKILVDLDVNDDRVEGLFETLFSAYATAYKTESLDAILQILHLRYLYQGEEIIDAIRAHREGTKVYVKRYDWLYAEPEVLMIADLALSRPALLRATIKNSDFEGVIAPMIDEFISYAEHR